MPSFKPWEIHIKKSDYQFPLRKCGWSHITGSTFLHSTLLQLDSSNCLLHIATPQVNSSYNHSNYQPYKRHQQRFSLRSQTVKIYTLWIIYTYMCKQKHNYIHARLQDSSNTVPSQTVPSLDCVTKGLWQSDTSAAS